MIWVWLLLVLVAIAIMATAVILCLPYWRSPEKRWRDAVFRAYQAAKRQVSAEAKELKRSVERREAEAQSVAREAFKRFLASISVSELEAYPGIGPATVGRLQQVGYTSLAAIQNARIRVHGLGEKRLADVSSAVRQLTREAESRFQAGACRESQELENRLQQLRLKYAEPECLAQARAKGAEEVVRQLEKPVSHARQVTFWKYFWKDAQVVVPPEVLQRPLPDLRAAVRTAEQRAQDEFRTRQAGGNASLDPKSRKAKPVADAVPVLDALTAPVATPRPPTAPVGIPVLLSEEDSAGAHPANRALSSLRPSTARLPNARQPAEPAQELLETTIEFAYAVARTDGSIARKERALIEEQFQRRYVNDPAIYNRVKAYCAHYETAAIDVESCIRRIKDRVPVLQRGHLLKFACMIAEASGPMNQREVRLLERVSREWEVAWKPPAVTPVAAPEPTRPMPAPPAAVLDGSPASPDPRTMLEIDPSAELTADLIRRKYNLLSSRLTAEKVEAMGPEFVAMAQSKREAMRAAAEGLLRPFGEPLERPDAPAEPTELRHNPDLDKMFGA